MDVSGIVRRSPWGLAVVALLGLSGCLPADRGWVREQLAPVQGQVAEVRDRVAVVEEQVRRLDPKVDRILTQMERQWQQSIASEQHPAGPRFPVPLPSPSEIPGNLPVEATLDLTITREATPRAGGTTPPRPAPVKALTPTPPGRAAHPDSHVVRWQEAVVAHQYPVAKPFTFSLPRLDRNPKDVPVEVTLDASGDRPTWLQFDREQLSMHGVAPSTAKNQTYRLIVRAHAAPGNDSQLLVLLTITGQPDELAPTRLLPAHWTW
jgi:hypothetical protein